MKSPSELKERLLDIVNGDRFHTVVSTSIEVCGHIVEYSKRPGIASGARIALSLGKTVFEMYSTNQWTEDYFPYGRWVRPSLDVPLRHIVHDVVSKFGTLEMARKAKDDNLLKRYVINGMSVGFAVENNDVNGVFVHTTHAERLKSELPDLVKRFVDSDTIVLQRKIDGNSESIELRADKYEGLRGSKTADDIVSLMRRYMQAGFSRSLLMFGMAGSGKSTLARVIVHDLGLRTLRIKVEDVGQLNVTTMGQLIEYIQPEAVIIDDFDRSSDQRRLLELMETLKRSVKIIIATINDRDNLDEAIMRPGRFDELIEINTLDPEVVRNVLGEYQDAYDTVKDWPIAFINEYIVRRSVTSAEQAKASLAELSERIERLKDSRSSTNAHLMRLLSAAKVQQVT